MEYKGLTLDHFQTKAIQLIQDHQSLIVSAPTGAGKTVIAEYAIEMALKTGKSIIYTAPIKALSNQKFRDFKQQYNKNVGIMTGDLTLNGKAPIVIMTTEIFRNALFENPERFADVSYLIFDEVHYLDDQERGTVWEESIIFAPPHIQVLCLSATIPNIRQLAKWIESVRNTTVHIVSESKRPVPLEQYCILQQSGITKLEDTKRYLPKKIKKVKKDYKKSRSQNFHDSLEHVITNNQLPCLYFVFSRKACKSSAQRCKSLNLLTKEEQQKIKKRLDEFSRLYGIECSTSYDIGAFLIRGIAYHHAGMLPAYKEIVELLFTEGLIKLLFATETFALGVNMPATSVIFSDVKKYDGTSMRFLKALEYQQMSGRAGRRGMDEVGYVYANIPEDEMTIYDLNKMFSNTLDPIQSQFNLSYSTLLSLYEHLKDDIVKASDKSFGTFQKSQDAKQQGKKNKQTFRDQRKLLKKKLSFLKTLGYLKDNTLSSKGRFATQINGYEIQLTELFFDGILEDANEASLFVIVVSIVFEGKKGRFKRIPKEWKKLSQRVETKIQTIRNLEYMLEIKEEVKLPDFRLAEPTFAWAMGKSFNSLRSLSVVDPGDLIRNFRLAIQLIRQLRKACTGYDSFVGLIDRCLLAVNRDEVNALKQLQAFSEFSGNV